MPRPALAGGSYGREMVSETAHEFAARLWSRVVHDEAILAAASSDLLLSVLDADGLESYWIERTPAVDSRRESSGDPLNARKHIAKRIAQTDAITAAAAVGPATGARSLVKSNGSSSSRSTQRETQATSLA